MKKIIGLLFEDPVAPVETPVDDLGFNELRALAKERHIEGYGAMKKEELIQALQGGE